MSVKRITANIVHWASIIIGYTLFGIYTIGSLALLALASYRGGWKNTLIAIALFISLVVISIGLFALGSWTEHVRGERKG